MDERDVAKQRCQGVIERIHKLPSSTNITDSCKRTLLKLAHSDLNFLSSLPNLDSPLSVNIGHLEAVVQILQQPFINGVSRVCKPLPSTGSKGVHVDIVCTLNKKPVWIIVSDRNPNYVFWDGFGKIKGLKSRVEQVVAAARSSQTLRPSSIVFFFANGLPKFVHQKLRDEFGASVFPLHDFDFEEDFKVEVEVEGGLINLFARSYREVVALEIKIGDSNGNGFPKSDSLTINNSHKRPKLNMGGDDADGDVFSSLLSTIKSSSSALTIPVSADHMDLHQVDFVNFDTTALIALVSGISNGCAQKLLSSPTMELEQRFKGNLEFVIQQVMSEIQNPIHVEMSAVLCGRRGIICESVFSEFKELVLMCGGPNEKLRADQLLKHLKMVPDSPSKRMVALPTTRKLAMKNKVTFGTGDYWHAPTLTANMGFVRAVAQTGMSLFTIEHRPRALTGD